MKHLRRSILAVFASATLIGGFAGPAAAHVEQDGLVNVSVGDIEVLNDANIGVAALVAANLCDVQIGPVAVLGQAVDRSGDSETVCTIEDGEVTITQN